MSSEAVAETEKLIRSKLQSSGQLDKLRAMVVDASLAAITNNGKDAEALFTGTKALETAKATPDGMEALSVTLNFLNYLGLTYTANVLTLEAGLKSLPLLKEDQIRASRSLPVDQPSLLGLLRPKTTPQSAPAPSIAPAVAGPVAAAPTPKPSAVVQAATKPAVATPKSKSVETLYEIAEWEDREFTRFNQVAGQQVQLYNLKSCTVHVYDPLDSMTVDDCVGGELVLAACEGSLFLRNCKNMVVYAACKQLRLRDCEHLDIRLFATTDPVVEMSHHITLKPFNLRIPNLSASFKAARLDPAVNRFVNVYDFTVDDPKLPQPHFTVVYPDHGLVMQDVGAKCGAPEAPKEIEELLIGSLAPSASSESGQNKSHNIKTGSGSWKNPVGVTTGVPAAVKPVEVKPVEVKPVEVKPVEVKPVEVKPVSAPAVPVPVPVVEAKPAALPVPAVTNRASSPNEDQYSSYSESTDEDDKCEVDEDEDEF